MERQTASQGERKSDGQFERGRERERQSITQSEREREAVMETGKCRDKRERRSIRGR